MVVNICCKYGCLWFLIWMLMDVQKYGEWMLIDVTWLVDDLFGASIIQDRIIVGIPCKQ